MRLWILAAAAALTAGSAIAELRADRQEFIYRDSDGDVISMIYDKDIGGWVFADGSVVYFTAIDLNGVPTTLEFMLDTDIVLLGGGEGGVVRGGAANGGSLSVGGQNFELERSGGQVFLRNSATGERFATERRVAANGATINPKRFGLD